MPSILVVKQLAGAFGDDDGGAHGRAGTQANPAHCPSLFLDGRRCPLHDLLLVVLQVPTRNTEVNDRVW